MSFRYVNPGYAEWLSSRNGAITEQNSTYNSNNGVVMKSADNDYVEINNITEIYFKFNLLFLASASFRYNSYGIMFRSGNGESASHKTGMRFIRSDQSWTYQPYVYGYYDDTAFDTGLTLPSLKSENHSIWCHIKMKTAEGAEAGLIEISIDKGKNIVQKSFDSVANFYSNKLFIHLPSDCRVSNIIISDEYIDPKEQIISLPISSTESDMTFDSETGIYTATAENQSLLAAVNVTSLIEEYGSDSTVTGVARVGNPAYKTAEGLSSLTAFSKDSSGNVIDYGTYALGSESSGVIADNQILTGKTISDLQNLKFGWLAK